MPTLLAFQLDDLADRLVADLSLNDRASDDERRRADKGEHAPQGQTVFLFPRDRGAVHVRNQLLLVDAKVVGAEQKFMDAAIKLSLFHRNAEARPMIAT